jgi:hypothetical protein
MKGSGRKGHCFIWSQQSLFLSAAMYNCAVKPLLVIAAAIGCVAVLGCNGGSGYKDIGQAVRTERFGAPEDTLAKIQKSFYAALRVEREQHEDNWFRTHEPVVWKCKHSYQLSVSMKLSELTADQVRTMESCAADGRLTYDGWPH